MPSTEAQQHRKAVAFRDLHRSVFVVANAWDAGSARVLARAGSVALATTSAGLAYALGVPDGSNRIDRAATLANARSVAEATDLPVTADLESGFGETAAELEETFRQAAEAGLVGGSIEDATGVPEAPIRPLDEAVDRVRQVVGVVRRLPFPFTLTARAENFLYGRPDLDDTVRRLVAYRRAGADVLYGPGLPTADALRRICAVVDGPVNALVGSPPAATVAELAALGARRVSLGSLLARLALTAAANATAEIARSGTLPSPADALSYADVNAFLRDRPAPTDPEVLP
jgi:2-methylisocitrate lyase-like PEP mutase family enzyme